MARILFIASGFPPYEFSENIINGKLVLALIEAGHKVTVLTKVDEGNMYGSTWQEPWLPLQDVTQIMTYPVGNKITRAIDILKKTLLLKYPIGGVRWAGLAYKKSLEIIKTEKIDVILTRSPSDIAHLVGLKLKKKTDIKWIANWNDPATGIWPAPYEVRVPLLKKLMFKSFTQEALSRADINTFPSKLLSEHFQQYYKISTNKIVVIPHVIYPEITKVDNVKSNNSLRICHSGNLSIERDPENLFIALHKFNKENQQAIYLDILGVSTNYSIDLVNKYQLEKFVTFLKPLSYTAALRKMAEYDVLMIVEAKMEKSIFLPSKITDYAQLNKPILSVSPPNSEVGNLIKKYGGGVVAINNSIDDIYEKLSYLDVLKKNLKLDQFTELSALNGYLGAKAVVSIYNKYLY